MATTNQLDHSTDAFVASNGPTEGTDRFDLENGKLLDIEVDGSVMTKSGTMVAHDGRLTFMGKASAESGITGLLKQRASGEGTPIMSVEGRGHVYVADQGKEIQLVELDAGESISVNGNDILAFDGGVDYSIRTIGSLAGMSAGGLTNVHLTGPGMVAITTHGEPLVLEPPIRTDPSATVAWSSSLTPNVKTNRRLLARVPRLPGERRRPDAHGPALDPPTQRHRDRNWTRRL